MAFALEKGFGVPTELVTPESFSKLLDDPGNRWRVEKIRAIKSDPDNPAWTGSDFGEWLRRQPAATKSALREMTQQEQALAWADGMKKSLPGIIFTAFFEEGWTKGGRRNGREVPRKYGRYRGKERCRLTGLVCIDVDHCTQSHDPQDVRDYWQRLMEGRDLKAMGVLLAYVSASGDGFKMVFKARGEWGNLIDNQLMMAQELGLKIDTVCKDASRNQFLTTRDDVLYMDDELFTYEDREYSDRYTEAYRQGKTQQTLFRPNPDGEGYGQTQGEEFAEPASILWRGHPIQEYIDAVYADKKPCKKDSNRHTESLKLAYDLLIMLDGDRELVEKTLREQSWVQEIVRERNEDVEETVSSASARKTEKEKKYNPWPSERMQKAILQVTGAPYHTGKAPKNATGDTGPEVFSELPLEEWGEQIQKMQDTFPCLRELCKGRQPATLPAILFSAAAMLGTLMTRTWYHFYHRPHERRRLNYSVFIIGDPGSGKSDIGELCDVLMAPVADSDNVGYDALNRWKREKQERQSSSKEQKKEALKKPEVVIRMHPARTSNGVFIEDMRNAVEMVGQDLIHLHLFTFDSELDNNTKLSGGGSASWINKEAMELKAFHNEKDGQAFGNADSVMGEFHIYWNFIYTGTMLALRRKITEANFGSGLATRLAVIPMPPTNFRMMELTEPVEDEEGNIVNKVLTEWAYQLDKVAGELPLWPLVKETHVWTKEHMTLAEIDGDKAEELLLKRIAYYGISISTPFILMRHWQEWTEQQTFDIDEQDLQLCRLALDIQYRTQHHYFGEYAFNYFADMDRDPAKERRRARKTTHAFAMLDDTFTIEDVMKSYEKGIEYARVIVCRLIKENCIEKTNKDTYHKLVKSL